MNFVVSFGGGITSYEALRRTIMKHGKPNVTAVFADVGSIRDEQGRVVCGEDADLHRFMSEVEDRLEFKINRIKAEGFSDIWDVFFKERMMGNSKIDPCSREMKRRPLDAWIQSRFMPLDATLVVGLDWTEPTRCEDFANAMQPWRVYFPLCEPPFVTKAHLIQCLRNDGIEPPSLYEDGFGHNNCGGFCVKMGHEQAYRLWKFRPHVYAFHELKEESFRVFVGKDVSILRDRRKGVPTQVLTLRMLRFRFEAGYIPKRRPGEGCGGACITPEKMAA